MKEIVKWGIESDIKNIRKGAIELQSVVHEKLYAPVFRSKSSTRSWFNQGRTYWRKTLLEKFEIFSGNPISGKVLEIGAGTGWCSGLISLSKFVNEVYAVEYDKYCIETLMPLVHKNMEANIDKIKYVWGSFNYMPIEEQIDVVVSIGALHHSENLYRTMEECFKVLKPGGYLIASEPVELNCMTQSEANEKYNTIDPNSMTKYGKIVSHKDNSDHYYRLCEYEASSYKAGFDVFPYIFTHNTEERSDDQIFRDKKCYEGFRIRENYPYFSVDDLYDPLFLILQKPAA